MMGLEKIWKVSMLCIALLALAPRASAQFFLAGDDPGPHPWRQMQTQTYKIVYPKGLDSLAREYAILSETWKNRVGATLFVPGESTHGSIPIVLHSRYSVSNGSVAWAPRRIDVYTHPDAYDPTPIPWSKMLMLHEQRHVAQMQTGLKGAHKYFGWFFGEMWNGLCAGIYGSKELLEGDAVITETALTGSGRGREADFLNYYMVSFDNGDWRDWYRWRCGSQRYYTPDHYALGYMTFTGIRYNYNMPDISRKIYDRVTRKVFSFGLAGARFFLPEKRTIKDEFLVSARTFYDEWAENADARAPYMPMEQVTPTPRRFYSEYSDLVMMNDGLYGTLWSLDRTKSLVRIDTTGAVKRLRPFSTYASGLYTSPTNDRLFWSENVAAGRWSLKSRSAVRTKKTEGQDKSTVTLPGGKDYFNPVPSPDATSIAVVEYLENTRTRLVILAGDDYSVKSVVAAPDSLQLLEPGWFGGDVYVTALSESGYGIYRLSGGEWSVALAPSPVKITDFDDAEEFICFTSDRTGSSECYAFYPGSGKVFQLTSSRYGASDYEFSLDGKWLYYSASTQMGKQVFRTAVEDLPIKEVDFFERYHWGTADKLSEQEEAAYAEMSAAPEEGEEISVSEPRRYDKFAHIFNVHSWAPVYFNVDNIMNMSYDHIYDMASVGVAALAQNNLGTAVTNFGYSFHPDDDGTVKEGYRWRHSGHIKFTYTGLLPVIEATFDVNDRARHANSLMLYTKDKSTISGVAFGINDDGASAIFKPQPLLAGSLSLYVPLSFSRGGVFSGFIPKVRYGISNDYMDCCGNVIYLTGVEDDPETEEDESSEVLSAGSQFRINQSLTVSARGYVVGTTAPSAVYPRWGFGAEMGYHSRLGTKMDMRFKDEVSLFCPAMYTYAYGYLPGFYSTQGWRLSGKLQFCPPSAKGLLGSSIVNTLPRGYKRASGLLSRLANYGYSAGFTADYGIPVFMSDINLWKGVFYIKRLVLTPHFDYTFYGSLRDKTVAGNLWSAGLDVNLDFGSFATITVPVSIGIRYDYNGGSGFNDFVADISKMSHHFVGPLFTLDF